MTERRQGIVAWIVFFAGLLPGALIGHGATCFGQTTRPAVGADLPFIAKGATIELAAGRTYALRVTTTLRGATIRGNGAVIQYLGGNDFSSAFQGEGTVQDVQFVVGGKRYAWAGAGTVHLNRCSVAGGGGLLKGDGATAYLDGCVQKDMTIEYVVYSARSSISITSCVFDKGSRDQSVCRFHAFPLLVITHSKLDDTMGPKAALRAHDGVECDLSDDTILGDANFGPMGEGDGGINIGLLPDGSLTKDPKILAQRAAADALRLQRLFVSHCTISTRTIKINPGVLAGAFSDCVINSTAGDAAIAAPWPYMTRPQSRVSFVRCVFTHANAKTLSSSYVFPTTQSTLNGKQLP